MRQQGSRRRTDVEYYITLSPTYQVPVLYFSLLNCLPDTAFDGGPAGPDGLDAIYDHVVPPQFKSNLRDVGVMGGISIGVCFLCLHLLLPSQRNIGRSCKCHRTIRYPAYRHTSYTLATQQMPYEASQTPNAN